MTQEYAIIRISWCSAKSMSDALNARLQQLDEVDYIFGTAPYEVHSTVATPDELVFVVSRYTGE